MTNLPPWSKITQPWPEVDAQPRRTLPVQSPAVLSLLYLVATTAAAPAQRGAGRNRDAQVQRAE